METQTIKFDNELQWLQARTKDLTSTDVPSLFGVSPWISEFELWHRKKNQSIGEFEANERMEWGTALQDGIAAKVAADKMWKIRRMDEYVRIPSLRIGASFDFSIEDASCNADAKPEWLENGLLEVKNVDGLQFKKGWLVEKVDGGDDYIEAPPHIEIQVQHQLLVSGRKYAYIAALIGGNKQVLIYRERQQDVIGAIMVKCAAFWKSIDANIQPEPNFSRDASFISKLYGYAEPGKVMDGSEDDDLGTLMDQHRTWGRIERNAKKEKEVIKAKVLTKIGDAEKVYGVGWTLSTVTIGPAHVSYDRRGYRMFKPSYTTKQEVEKGEA